MASDKLVTYDTRQMAKVTAALKRLKKEGEKVEKPLKRFGVYHVSQTIKGFNKSGRESRKWKKLAPMTLSMRRSAGIKGVKPLIARGTARRSIQTTILKYKGNVASSTFTRLKYMAIHQTGGQVKRSRGPNSRGPAGYNKIPQRKFLVYTKADNRMAVKLIVKHEKEAIRKAGLKRKGA